MMEDLSQCPACSGTSFSEYLICKDNMLSKEEFRIVTCTQCGLNYTNPRPGKDEIAKYYDSEEYISHSNSNKGLVNKIYQIIRKQAIQSKLKLIDKERDTLEKSVLDIGCGTGEFLSYCSKQGWSVRGIEPNPKARDFARENYSLEVGDEVDLDDEKKEFSIITLWHVLEHVHDLSRRLKQINRLLKISGKAIVAVPNWTSWDANEYGKFWAAYDVPRHLYHFSPDVIKKLFQANGFSHEHSVPMKFDSYYVSMLSEKYKQGKGNLPLAFINGMRSNYHAGKNAEKYSSVIYVFKKQNLFSPGKTER